ncbi:hypothetical protein [Mesorhizobium sp.]|uniref:hypothetical protein n=1 Tax=Mesorhizobium sp. TaxID=1871066 RepID=UPI000FE3620E|nr:hypothetical protein [Mesorhizobium sp.]RWA60736.1 MAG: hypothetical protein EOQ28_32195 [Mesorhizobium sp.]RWB93815.1 MAG: hypothetical protein EOQ57_33325 [Mesorhizobium sp.]RWG86787.1 MAG: hypothetical protein EOQ69_05385 [Mesorhizobium sp.]RWG90389.1 MAG: hypothetical protein EOQ70_04225 [Mesorhizobium sp.]RWK09469.1 MAG: hypothetical protein EOR42_01785 [Mesorhizobium sp.]
MKSSLILSDVVALKKVIDESLSNANDRGLTGLPLWKRVLPIVGSYQLYDVDAAELSPLIAAKDSHLMQNAVTLFMQHRNLVEAVKLYSEKRERVKEIVKNHLAVQEGVITSGLTKEELSQMLPLEIEMESLIKSIRVMVSDLIELGELVTFGIGPEMRKFFGTNDFPLFEKGKSPAE